MFLRCVIITLAWSRRSWDLRGPRRGNLHTADKEFGTHPSSSAPAMVKGFKIRAKCDYFIDKDTKVAELSAREHVLSINLNYPGATYGDPPVVEVDGIIM